MNISDCFWLYILKYTTKISYIATKQSTFSNSFEPVSLDIISFRPFFTLDFQSCQKQTIIFLWIPIERLLSTTIFCLTFVKKKKKWNPFDFSINLTRFYIFNVSEPAAFPFKIGWGLHSQTSASNSNLLHQSPTTSSTSSETTTATQPANHGINISTEPSEPNNSCKLINYWLNVELNQIYECYSLYFNVFLSKFVGEIFEFSIG